MWRCGKTVALDVMQVQVEMDPMHYKCNACDLLHICTCRKINWLYACTATSFVPVAALVLRVLAHLNGIEDLLMLEWVGQEGEQCVCICRHLHAHEQNMKSCQ